MPSYSYICEVCSTKVDKDNDRCPTCGCPAIKNLKELEWFKEKWDVSDKSKQIEVIKKNKIPFCAFTSIGILASWFWYNFLAPLSGSDGDMGYMFINVMITFLLAIIGTITGFIHIRSYKPTSALTNTCLTFSLILVSLILILILTLIL